MSQVLAKTEKVKGIEKAMNEAMCRESERKRDIEKGSISLLDSSVPASSWL